MAMLAEKRQKTRWVLNPKTTEWSNDSSKYGQRLMEQMGWKTGCGLGVNLQGPTEHVRVSLRSDLKGVGFKDRPEDVLPHQNDFSDLLARLAESGGPAESAPARESSLESKSRQSRVRVHYHKFTRGKDLSRYSEKDLVCIFGDSTKTIRSTNGGNSRRLVPSQTQWVKDTNNHEEIFPCELEPSSKGKNTEATDEAGDAVDCERLEAMHRQSPEPGGNTSATEGEKKEKIRTKCKWLNGNGMGVKDTLMDESDGRTKEKRGKKRKTDEALSSGQTWTDQNVATDSGSCFSVEPSKKKQKKMKDCSMIDSRLGLPTSNDCRELEGTSAISSFVGVDSEVLEKKKKKKGNSSSKDSNEEHNLSINQGAVDVSIHVSKKKNKKGLESIEQEYVPEAMEEKKKKKKSKEKCLHLETTVEECLSVIENIALTLHPTQTSKEKKKKHKRFEGEKKECEVDNVLVVDSCVESQSEKSDSNLEGGPKKRRRKKDKLLEDESEADHVPETEIKLTNPTTQQEQRAEDNVRDEETVTSSHHLRQKEKLKKSVRFSKTNDVLLIPSCEGTRPEVPPQVDDVPEPRSGDVETRGQLSAGDTEVGGHKGEKPVPRLPIVSRNPKSKSKNDKGKVQEVQKVKNVKYVNGIASHSARPPGRRDYHPCAAKSIPYWERKNMIVDFPGSNLTSACPGYGTDL